MTYSWHQLNTRPAEIQASQNTDGVFNYHNGFPKLALLEWDFQDSMKEVMEIHICFTTNKQAEINSLEALKLQLDIHVLVYPGLTWSRIINTGGAAWQQHGLGFEL